MLEQFYAEFFLLYYIFYICPLRKIFNINTIIIMIDKKRKYVFFIQVISDIRELKLKGLK